MNSKMLGHEAIVVGAGMAGLTAAAALADHFERVTILERDRLLDQSSPRPGVAQGKHFHALLPGGAAALDRLFPGFYADIEAAGAVVLISGLDLRMERPGHDPMPQRDLGMRTFSLSRPLLELCVRKRVRALERVAIEDAVVVRGLIAEGGAVTGVEIADRGPRRADLVVDASGRGELTAAALTHLGHIQPRVESVGVDVHYATAIFRIPDDAPSGWKGVMTFPDPRKQSCGAMLAPTEGGHWTCLFGERGSESAPADAPSFLNALRSLRTTTIYDAVEHTQMVVPPARYIFPESQQRHFEELTSFPAGLLPIGDALCRFNPIYGQGMSVAALEADALTQLLDAGSDLGSLATAFFAKAAEVIAAPWRLSVIPDFNYPQTRGERPANLAQVLRFGSVLNELIARDPEVHRLANAVASLVAPASALSDPTLIMRVLTLEQELQREDPVRWAPVAEGWQ